LTFYFTLFSPALQAFGKRQEFFKKGLAPGAKLPTAPLAKEKGGQKF
jgi:hypothetical protein